MTFSQEAKDFVESFKSTGKFINDYQMNKARKGYYEALTNKLNRADPVAGAFENGRSALDNINTSITGDSSPLGVATSVDQVDTDINSENAGGLKPEAPTSLDQIDTSMDSAGALPEIGNFMDVMPEAEAMLPAAAEGMGMMGMGSYSSGGIVHRMRAYANGGMVEDDDGEFGYEPVPAAEGAEGVAPDDGVLPTGGPEGSPEVRVSPMGRKDTLLGMALHGSTMFLQDMFSMRDTQPQGAMPVDPGAAHPNGGRFMFAGLGAASKGEYDDVMKVIDPHGKLDDNIRNIAGIKSVYDYYLKRGDIDKANKAAASLVQYTRNVSAEYGGQAIEAYNRGDFKNAAALIEKGYNQIPDGNKIDVTMTKNGGGYVTQLNEDGQVVQQGPFSPEMLMQAATGMKNGSLFWNQIVQSAQRQLGNEPSKAYAAAMQRLYNMDESGPGGGVPSGADGGGDAAPDAAPGAEGGGTGGEGAVTSPGNAAGAAAGGLPPKPVRPVIEHPDPKMLAKMSRQEQVQVVAATNQKNQMAKRDFESKLKEWEKAVAAHKAQASRMVLDKASSENYGLDENGVPKEGVLPETPAKPGAVDTGEYFAPGGAAKSSDGNVMGVLDEDPEPAAPRPTAPQYRRYSNDPALTEADRRANRAEVNQINARLKSDYDKQTSEYTKAQTEQRKQAAKSGGPAVKTERRAKVEDDIASAWEQRVATDAVARRKAGQDPQQFSPQEAEWIKSAAYGIYSNNDMTGRDALGAVLSLTRVDGAEPRKLNFSARDTKDGFVQVQAANGMGYKVPKNTFNQLAQVRLDQLRSAEKQNENDAGKAAKRGAANAASAKVRERREAQRGVPAYGRTTLKGKAALPDEDLEE